MPNIGNNTLWIKEARLSFPALVEPKATQGGTPKYNCNFILTDQSPEWAEAMAIVGEIATSEWKEHAQNVLNMIQNDKRLRCYGVGSEKTNSQTGAVYEGFTEPGTVWISANSDTKPQLYGPNAQPLPPTANANQMFVGGNYVAGVVRFWPQDNQHGRAIRAQLVGVQYLRDGEHFGLEEVDAGSVFQAVPGAPAPTGAAPGMPAASPMPTGAAPAAPAPAPKPPVDFL